MESIKKYFEFENRKTNFKTEIVGGVIVFLAMFYIVMVQANMFGGFGLNAGSIAIMTALVAGICSIAMGVYSKHPLALAPGMGVNAFIAFTLMAGGMPFAAAMSAVMVSGILFLIIALTPMQRRILSSIPDSIKMAIAAGVGLFIMYVALVNTGIITIGIPDTPTLIGNWLDPVVVLAIIGIVITIILWALKIEGSTIIAMGITLVIGLLFLGINNWTDWGGENAALPGQGITLSGMGEIYSSAFTDLPGVVGQVFKGFGDVNNVWANPDWYLAVFVLLLNDMLDTTGTLFGVNQGMPDVEVEESTVRKIMIVDATSTIVGSVFGITNTTAYAESTSGVSYGARTGLSAVVVGTLFLLSIPVIPFLSPFITSSVTAGAIVIVGIMMGSLVGKIDFEDKPIAVASIFTIVFILLTYSIGMGIVIGLLIYTITMLCTGRAKEVDWILFAASPIFILFLVA